MLHLDIEGARPGDVLEREPGDSVSATVSWQSFHAVERAQIIRNGQVVHDHAVEGHEQQRRGQMRVDLGIPEDGWVAARLGSSKRDSFWQPLFAHTSPVYVSTGVPNGQAVESASMLADGLGSALAWVDDVGRFRSGQQRREVSSLFGEGLSFYESIVRTGGG